MHIATSAIPLGNENAGVAFVRGGDLEPQKFMLHPALLLVQANVVDDTIVRLGVFKDVVQVPWFDTKVEGAKRLVGSEQSIDLGMYWDHSEYAKESPEKSA